MSIFRNVRIMLAARIIIVPLALSAVLLGRAFAVEFMRNLRLRQELTRLKKNVAALEGSSQSLARTFNALERPLAIERAARETYGLHRAGEHVLILSGNTDATARQTTADASAPGDQGWRKNVRAWWEYFASPGS